MKPWKDQLREALANDGSAPSSELALEAFGDVVKEFASELSRNGLSADFEDRRDNIGLRVAGANGNLIVEFVAQLRPEPKLSVFSQEIILSNFRLKGLIGSSSEEILQFFVRILAAAMPSNGHKVIDKKTPDAAD